MQLTPYLTFNGDCARAFRFYEQTLGGTLGMQTHAESPMAGQTPAEWSDRILHARLDVGNAVLMGSDRPPSSVETPAGFAVSLTVDTPDEAERVFAALAEGGRVQMPLQQTFWAARFGMVTDRFAIPWMVNCSQAA
jgi:PhnB protein